MTSIFSNLSNILSLGGQQEVLPAGFIGPQQPPVPGPPTPGISEQINRSYQKISEQPGFNNALFKLGATLLAAREQGLGLGESFLAGQGAYNSEIDRAKAEQAKLAAAKLEQQKYLTDTALKMGQAQLNQQRFGLDQQRLGLDEKRYQAEIGRDLQNQALEARRIALMERQVTNETEAKERDRQLKQIDAQKKVIEESYQAGEAIRSGEQVVGQVEDLLKHPGFTGAVGSGFQKSLPFYGAGDESKLGGGFAAGSDAASFTERLKQLKGGAFLQAYQQLKGGGAIGVKEGEKAESSITRMSLAQDEKEFINAAREYQSIIKKAVETEKAKAKDKGISVPQIAPKNVVDYTEYFK